jgi:DNA-binding transcriptional MerR regulator
MDERKIFWSISEVSEILDVEPNVLRFWEKEFTIFKPSKNSGGNRSYQKKDIEIAQKIKYLLYEECFTLKGAIKKMKKLKSIPLENYKKLQKLVLSKEFSQDFDNFYKNLSQFMESTKL